MVDTISDVSRSFESGLSCTLHNERTASFNGSLDDSFGSFNSKLGLLQRFTELESLHPSVHEKKVSNKRRKKFTGSEAIKEVSPDSGQGDDDAISGAM